MNQIKRGFRRMEYPIRKYFYRVMDATIEDPKKPLYVLFRIAALFVVIVFIVNLFSIGTSNFGEWGDFFGGVLNPLLTFLTFMGLLITIVIQQTELRETRREASRSADALEKQNFEATFFQMLSLHNQIVSSIDLVSEGGRVTRGRDCFEVFYGRLKIIYDGAGHHDDDQRLEYAYQKFWKNTQAELGHYFRYLFNVTRFLSENKRQDSVYIRLLRAQLSDQELLLLFYNTLSPQGAAFRPLVEGFALFDNLPPERLLREDHVSKFSPAAFGSKTAAPEVDVDKARS